MLSGFPVAGTRLSKVEMLKKMIRALGEDRERVLLYEALTMLAATHMTEEEGQCERLRETLRDLLTRATNTPDNHGLIPPADLNRKAWHY